MRLVTGTGALLRPATVVAAVLALALAVVVVLEHRDRSDGSDPAVAPSEARQEAYGDVMAAAEATVTGLVNIDHRDPQASYEAVAATATGDFLDDYEQSFEALEELVSTYEAVQTGEVVATAVSTLDEDSRAEVIVYAEAVLENAETGDEQLARTYRVRLGMTRGDDGRWLTSQLEFVG